MPKTPKTATPKYSTATLGFAGKNEDRLSGARQTPKGSPQGERAGVHQFGVPPKGNANFAWVQHFIHHLAPHGMAGFVLSNGSMSSNQSDESDICRPSSRPTSWTLPCAIAHFLKAKPFRRS